MVRKILSVFLILIIVILSFFLFRERNKDIEIEPPIKTTEPNNLVYTEYVHTRGTKIVNKDGEEINLKGVNLGGWLMWEGWIWGAGFDSETKIRNRLQNILSPDDFKTFETQVYENFITIEDIAQIKSEGYNVIRIPVNHTVIEDEQKLKYLDYAISWAQQNNIYVIITLHSAPGGQSKLFTSDPDRIKLWESKKNINDTIELWDKLSIRYKTNRTVAAYDLINEPDTTNANLVNLYKTLITTIRNNNDPHMIILEGNNYAKNLDPLVRIDDPNIVYSFHMYTWFRDNREVDIENYKNISMQVNKPIWIGEFGENEYEILESTVDMFNEAGFSGWAFWTWKKVPNRYPYLNSISASDDWLGIAEYIESPWGQNEPNNINSGILEFINDIKFQNNELDSKMSNLLK